MLNILDKLYIIVKILSTYFQSIHAILHPILRFLYVLNIFFISIVFYSDFYMLFSAAARL